MQGYISELAWLSLWPLVIYLAYRFVRLNIDHLVQQEGN